MKIIDYISIISILIGILYLIIGFYSSKKNSNYPKIKRKGMNKICILIPARDESKVIEELLISIKNQTKKIDMKDVIIIVEKEEDPTVKIAKNYGATIFIRKKLNLKRKGYALEEAVEDLCNRNIYYDAYFIIDADNILDKDFIKEMEKTYIEGYDIAIGYRNLKNGNDSVVAACSGLTFAILNTNGNINKNRNARNVLLSGTGLYIDGKQIEKWKTFPFHSLTEDYELTLYSILHNLTSYYNDKAVFYDEQPIKYKNTINQRMRWIRGYFDNRRKYIPLIKKSITKRDSNKGSKITEIVGMKPYIFMVIGAVLYIINNIISVLAYTSKIELLKLCLIKLSMILIFTYITFIAITIFILIKDHNKLDLTLKTKIKAVLFSPIFFSTYLPCAIKTLFKKEIKWEKVEHFRRFSKQN